LTLDQIDEKDKKIIMRMLGNKDLKTFAEYDENPFLGLYGETVMLIATYTQNYLILKYLLNIRNNNTSQSQKIIEQNQEIIEQNKQTINQNQQIIDLLTEIKNKS